MKTSLVIIVSVFFAISLQAQKYVLYGTTYQGGSDNSGTLIKYDPISGNESVAYSFSANVSGSFPNGPLTLAKNGLLYGTTSHGGKYNYGTIFSYNPHTYILLDIHDFDSIHGWPEGDGPGIMQAKNGTLYGVTTMGGKENIGIIYSFSLPKDTLIVLHDFDSLTGGWPSSQKLAEDTANEFLYGTTAAGGTYLNGTLFSYSINLNTYTVLQSFSNSIGGNTPGNNLFMAPNGKMYVLILGNDSNIYGQILYYDPKANKDSVIFQLNDTLGADPQGDGMMMANNGLIYGTINGGGMSHPSGFYNGLIFSLDLKTNKYTPVYLFDSIHGGGPYCTLVQNPYDNLLYGTTQQGGNYNAGVIFSFDIMTNKEVMVYSFTTSSGDGYFPYAGLTLVQDSLAGINEINATNIKVQVFPNPSNGIFTFQMQGIYQKSEVEIYNMLGENVYNNHFSGTTTQIDLSNQPQGIYLYRITDEEGNLIKADKIIIER